MKNISPNFSLIITLFYELYIKHKLDPLLTYNFSFQSKSLTANKSWFFLSVIFISQNLSLFTSTVEQEI